MLTNHTERTQVGWGFWLWWVLASIVGLFVGLILEFAVEEAMGLSVGLRLVPEQYTVAFAVLGAPIGIAQWLVLRRQVSRAGWWVLASIVGFASGEVVGESVFEVIATFVFYGAITGGVLVWLLRQPVTEEPSLLRDAA